MGKYDGIGENAANETDKELSADVQQMLCVSNLSGLFPNESDKNLVNELIGKIQKSTNRNEMVTAYKVFAAKATVEGIKAFKEGFSIAKKLVI